MKNFLLMAVLTAFLPTAQAQAPTNATILAKKGQFDVTPLDVRAHNSQLTESEFASLLQTEPTYRRGIDEVLAAREGERRVLERLSTLDPLDMRSVEIARSRATLNAALTIADRAAREKAQKNTAASERRARELYETTDAESLKTPLAADIELILFDVSRHDSATIAKRIAAVEAAVKLSPDKFPDLAAEYSDEDNSRLKLGRIEKLPAPSTTEITSRVLFDQLKPGEVSKLLPHGRGLMFIRLIKIHAPTKRPFEGSIKDAAILRAQTEAGQAAREAERERLAGDAVAVLDDDKIRAQLTLPDPAAMVRWREAEAKRLAQESAGASMEGAEKRK